MRVDENVQVINYVQYFFSPAEHDSTECRSTKLCEVELTFECGSTKLCEVELTFRLYCTVNFCTNFKA